MDAAGPEVEIAEVIDRDHPARLPASERGFNKPARADPRNEYVHPIPVAGRESDAGSVSRQLSTSC
jgi:hypothetical protein